MARFIFPIIFLGISISIFFVFTSPFYQDISKSRKEISSYDEALNNSIALRKERDKLTAKYNSINKEDLLKIKKLLPDNIDNIRLILEIEKIASPYGMVLKDVKYNSKKKTTDEEDQIVDGAQMDILANEDYGVWDLEFSTNGTYSNFLNFTRDLEMNLRIVDIASIQFSSNVSGDPSSSSSESYKYDFKIKTYYLKN